MVSGLNVVGEGLSPLVGVVSIGPSEDGSLPSTGVVEVSECSVVDTGTSGLIVVIIGFLPSNGFSPGGVTDVVLLESSLPPVEVIGGTVLDKSNLVVVVVSEVVSGKSSFGVVSKGLFDPSHTFLSQHSFATFTFLHNFGSSINISSQVTW